MYNEASYMLVFFVLPVHDFPVVDYWLGTAILTRYLLVPCLACVLSLRLDLLEEVFGLFCTLIDQIVD